MSLYRNPINDDKKLYVTTILGICKNLESLDHTNVDEIKAKFGLGGAGEGQGNTSRKITLNMGSQKDIEGGTGRGTSSQRKRNGQSNETGIGYSSVGLRDRGEGSEGKKIENFKISGTKSC